MAAHGGEYRQGNGQRTAAKAGQIVNGSDAGCGQSDPSFQSVNNTNSLYCGNTSCSRGKTVLYSIRSNIRYAPVMELVDMRDLGSRAFSVWVRVPSGAPKRTTMTKSHGVSFYTSFIQTDKKEDGKRHPPLLHDSEKLKRASSWRRPWRPRSRCPEPSAHRGCGRPPRSSWTSWPRSAASPARRWRDRPRR